MGVAPDEMPSWSRVGSWSGAAFTGLLCAAALGASLLLYDSSFSGYDDGTAAEAARLVLQGKVPYRDFWALYAPGSYYANALLLAVLGESFLSIRLALPLLVLIQAAFLAAILKRVVGDWRPAAAAGAAYAAFVPIGITVTCPITYWLTAWLAAAYLLVRWTQEPRPRWEYLCGLCLGGSALFRQDGGVYATGAVIISIWLIAPRIGMSRIKSALRVFGAFAAVLIAVGLYFAAKGALGRMWQETVVFALTVFPRSRVVPYPLPWNRLLVTGKYYAPERVAFFYQLYVFWILPAALVVFAAVALYRMARGKGVDTQLAVYTLAVAAATLFVMVQIRPVGMRVAGSVAVSLVVFAALSTDRSVVLRRSAAALLGGGLIVYVGFAVAWVAGQLAFGGEEVQVKGGVYAGRGYAMILSLAADYIYKHTRPGEKILAGNPAIYFMASRDPATRYFEPHPCVTDTPEVQRQIIADMERERVRYFVRARDWDLESAYFTMESNRQPLGLIAYIERNYKVVLDLKMEQVYERITPFRTRAPGGNLKPRENVTD